MSSKSHEKKAKVTVFLRMAMWKHYIVLFGGFYDPGIKSEVSCRTLSSVRNSHYGCTQPTTSTTCGYSTPRNTSGSRSSSGTRTGNPRACTVLFFRVPAADLLGRPRSGFSFLPTPEGILLHGGYCKEYVKGSRPVGVMLDDTWFLRCVRSPLVLY